ncbi:membrane protein [Bradyrhizobium sp. SSBR45G]|uniref:outer membrane protein n=1 Tax=unclassified Bradyrhizobium TaxID=2631580 RepID=UPI00234294D6|nr:MULTISPECIES: outer membrane beta-barrel protein [unclassified Bradyrhizobium]GLH76818.1 membrane protein [Bradyrhizobium sp. SSBR45G]GLH83576.1 membrane protein [Bradyrhizobium sp. SSBR45R]
MGWDFDGALAPNLPATPYKAPACAAAPAPFPGTGVHAGANIGGAFTGNDAFAPIAGGNAGRLSGVIGGVQAGYNYQLSPLFVVGIENDLEFTGLSRKADLVMPAVSAPWLTSGRARAGFTMLDQRLWLYGTAGLVAGELKDGPIHKTKMGWTAGGGAEWAFLPTWSAKLEYLYTALKHDNLPDWRAAKLHAVRVGVNTHFDLFR